MQESINGLVLTNFLRMMRQVDARFYLVVEGPEDIDILEHHLNDSQVFVYPASGKKNALSAAKEISDASLRGMCVLVDRDTDGYTGFDQTYPDSVVASEFYDLASDLIHIDPEILGRLVRSHSQREEYLKYVTPGSLNLLDVAVQICSPLAILRAVSIAASLQVNVSKLAMSELLTAYEANDLENFILLTAVARSGSGLDAVEVSKAYYEAKASLTDCRSLISGHDLMAILAEIVRSRCGGKISRQGLEKSFYGTVTSATIRLSSVYRELTTKSQNDRFEIWADAAA